MFQTEVLTRRRDELFRQPQPGEGDGAGGDGAGGDEAVEVEEQDEVEGNLEQIN